MVPPNFLCSAAAAPAKRSIGQRRVWSRAEVWIPTQGEGRSFSSWLAARRSSGHSGNSGRGSPTGSPRNFTRDRLRKASCPSGNGSAHPTSGWVAGAHKACRELRAEHEHEWVGIDPAALHLDRQIKMLGLHLLKECQGLGRVKKLFGQAWIAREGDQVIK